MPPHSKPSGDGSLGLALILVMFAYGGWSDMSYVAAEVKNPAKNITRACSWGTLAVTAIYVSSSISRSPAAWGWPDFCPPAASPPTSCSARFGPWGARAISLLICISCLGAMNGMIFTGARVCYALGKGLALRLARPVERALGVPIRATLMQAAVTIALVIGFGLRAGGLKSLVIFTSPFFWGFFVLVGPALIVLRDREPDHPRLFRLPLFPILPAIFCLSSGYDAQQHRLRLPQPGLGSELGRWC